MRRLVYFGGGAAAGIVLLELIFRVLPVSSASEAGYYTDPMILTYPSGATFRTATGWNLSNSRLQHANNAGYLAERDFIQDASAVALIGDSYVEASMLPPEDRLAHQLEGQLRDRPVYAMGSPGTSMLDYAERIRFASSHFGVRDFVLLLESGDVMQAICGSGNISASCIDAGDLQPRVTKRPEAGTLKRVLRRSALAQYLYSQLKIDRAFQSWTKRGETPAEPPQPAAPARDQVLPRAAMVIETFFRRVRPFATGRLILVILPNMQPEIRSMLEAACRQAGAILIDTTTPLAYQTATTGLSNHVSPRDAHLNRLALQAVARAIAASFPSTATGPRAAAPK